MHTQRTTAGETATTNEFDAEIVRLNQEREARFAEINGRIEGLKAKNAELKDLCRQNCEQIRMLTTAKDAIGKEYRWKIADIREKMDGYYCNRTSSVHYRRFTAFCDLHPEVLQMWREFRQAEEGGAQ